MWPTLAATIPALAAAARSTSAATARDLLAAFRSTTGGTITVTGGRATPPCASTVSGGDALAWVAAELTTAHARPARASCDVAEDVLCQPPVCGSGCRLAVKRCALGPSGPPVWGQW